MQVQRFRSIAAALETYLESPTFVLHPAIRATPSMTEGIREHVNRSTCIAARYIFVMVAILIVIMGAKKQLCQCYGWFGFTRR
jgi:hypothetical protein